MLRVEVKALSLSPEGGAQCRSIMSHTLEGGDMHSEGGDMLFYLKVVICTLKAVICNSEGGDMHQRW